MSQTFIPGYLAEITINTEDYTIFGNVMGLSMSKTAPRKPTFGVKASQVVSGQQSWSLSASGHVAKEGPISALLAAADSAVPVAYSIQVGEASGATDVGSFDGTLVISGCEFSADAEGEWDWSLSAEINGDNPFTPAV